MQGRGTFINLLIQLSAILLPALSLFAQSSDVVYWYSKGERVEYSVQPDAIVFNNEGNPNDNIPGSISAARTHAKYLPINRLEKAAHLQELREEHPELMVFTAITKHPRLTHEHDKWIIVDNRILVVFKNEKISIETIN